MDTLTGDNLAAVTTIAGPFWLLCDGTTQSGVVTPDYRGMAPFGVLGYGTGATGPATVGATGGAATHTLILNEIPAHSHNYTQTYATDTTDAQAGTSDTNAETAYATSATTVAGGEANGSTKAHNNMPPFFGVYWIKRSARIYYTA